MIDRFKKVCKNLYRGSKPSPKDVEDLQKNFNIKKIVSLDEESGEKISRVCKLLGINQEKVYIDDSKKSILNFLQYDLKKLLLDGGPTFVHCKLGKDRTGLVIALFKCKYMDLDPIKALEEAKSLGFGLNVDPKFIGVFEKLIMSCKPNKDINNADIVSNQREYRGDNRDSFLDEALQGSFAPYLSPTRQNPMDSVYNFIVDQSPTRENYHSYKSIKEHNHEDVIPLVGVFNNDAGIRGAGPVENYSGFFYD